MNTYDPPSRHEKVTDESLLEDYIKKFETLASQSDAQISIAPHSNVGDFVIGDKYLTVDLLRFDNKDKDYNYEEDFHFREVVGRDKEKIGIDLLGKLDEEVQKSLFDYVLDGVFAEDEEEQPQAIPKSVGTDLVEVINREAEQSQLGLELDKRAKEFDEIVRGSSRIYSEAGFYDKDSGENIDVLVFKLVNEAKKFEVERVVVKCYPPNYHRVTKELTISQKSGSPIEATELYSVPFGLIQSRAPTPADLEWYQEWIDICIPLIEDFDSTN